jgi:hypothetical protein
MMVIVAQAVAKGDLVAKLNVLVVECARCERRGR